MTNDNVLAGRDDPRQRKLDEMFLEQPYLSATMKAFRMKSGTEVGVISKPVFADGPLSSGDDGWLLERRAALRALVTSMPAPEAIVPISCLPTETPPITLPVRRAEQKPETKAEVNEPLAVESAGQAPSASKKPTIQSEVRTSYPDVLTLGDAASYLRFGVSTVRAWVKQGHIPHVLIGRTVRFRREALERWLASMERFGEMPS